MRIMSRYGALWLGFLALSFAHCGGSSQPIQPNSDATASDDATMQAMDAATFSTVFHVAHSQNAACAVFPDGRMKCWGRPTIGEVTAIGDAAGEMGASLAYVSATRKIRKVASGPNAPFCVIFEDGGARCWGLGHLGQPAPNGNQFGQITTDIDFGSGRKAADIAVNSNHACAVLDNGSVKCWGSNDQGELGQGDTTTRETPPVLPVALGTARTAKKVSVGFGFTCALLDNDRLKCWGRNANTVNDGGIGGVLGIGNTNHIGNDPNEMGDNLQYARLGANPATTQPWPVKKVGTGRTHACALLENDRIKCWGRNDGGGQLGSENTTAYGGSVVDDNIPFVNLGTNPATTQPWKVLDLAVGEYATCALLENRTVRCWGQDAGFGTLGRGTVNATIGNEPGEMGDQLPELQLGLAAGQTASSVSAGSVHMCATVGPSTLKCWGWNAGGVLGQGLPTTGTSSSIGDVPGEMGANLVSTELQ
jgi:alpha-tubulin suppressor-like RCC1 family protein